MDTHLIEEKPIFEWDLSKDKDFNLELDYYDEKKQEDKLWQARTGLNIDTLCGAIETLVFMSDRPIPLNKIRSQIDEELPLRVIHDSIARLQAEYESKHHGIRLMEVAEGYQFRTKPAYSKFVQDLFKVNSLVLSPTSLEVLAMIAYEQPISKTEIEKIRGVDSSHIIRGLMDKRLVRITGRSEEMGRPSLYGTTQEFLEVFNLSDLSELPSEHELNDIAEGESVGEINEIKSIVGGEKTHFEYDEFVELDELSQSIKSISSETDFIRSLKSASRKRGDEETEEVKSAFDILEEFMRNDEISVENKNSSLSEVLTSAVDVNIVSLKELSEGKLFNAPEVDESDEEELDDFENIQEDQFSVEASESEEIREFEEIDDAVEEAFASLLEKANIDVLSVEEGEAQLDKSTQEASEKAAEFDIDLNFLQEDVDTESQKEDSQQD